MNYDEIMDTDKYAAIANLLDMTAEVPGCVCKFGVWKGQTTAFIAEHLARRESDKWVVGFGHFLGLPDGRYKGDLSTVTERLREAVRTLVVVGAVEDSLEVMSLVDGCSFALIDTDLYSPAKAVLTHLPSQMPVGAIIVSDQYGIAEWEGETRAVDEFLAEHGREWKAWEVPGTWQPRLAMKRTC